MSDLNREKLVERIRKLIALSTSPNENEAARAAEKVQELLAEHNLSMIELSLQDIMQEYIRDSGMLTDNAGWVKPLMRCVAELYFCGYYFTPIKKERIDPDLEMTNRTLYAGNHATTYLNHSFVGEFHNVLVVKSMAEYLISAMERLCRKAQKEIPQQERSSFRTSFMNSCAARLCFRLHERKIQTSACGIKSEGTNLPALRPMYDAAQSAFEQWIKENLKQGLKQAKNKIRITDMRGYEAGRKAGDSIGLDQQIQQNKAEALLK